MIDDWLADQNGPPLFLLTGDPGAGKTALAAQLARVSSGAAAAPEGTAQIAAGFLSAAHFCSVYDRRWINPRTFADSLAGQLSQRYPRYAEIVRSSVAPTISANVAAVLNQGQMVGVEIGTVVTADPEDAFNQLVREPLEVLVRDPLTGPVTILVDALDESLAHAGRVTIANLVAQAENLSNAVRFLVTCRTRTSLLRSLQRRSPRQYTLSPRPADPAGSPEPYAHVLRDVQEYVQEVLREKSGLGPLRTDLAPERYISAICNRSEGNFLYVRYLLRSLLRQEQPITGDSITALPAGLDEIYLDFIQRLVPSMPEWSGTYGKVLGVLAVGQVPLTEDQISAFAGLGPVDTGRALRSLHELVETDGNQLSSHRRYSLYHSSLAEFLLDQDSSEEYWLDRASLHRLIADHYWTSRGASWSSCDDYGLRYLATHLLAAGEVARLQSLVDEDWMRVRLEQSRHSFDGILNDIETAWRGAEQEDRAQVARGDRPRFLAESARWALSFSSLSSLLRAVPADLPAALVRSGEWSPTQGLSYARHVAGADLRSRALAVLAAELPEELRKDVFLESISGAMQLTDGEQRASVLTGLLPWLPGEQRRHATIQVLAVVRDLTDRERIAGGYKGYYGSGEAERYRDTRARTSALTKLGEVLLTLGPPGATQAEILDQLRALCARDEERFPTAAADFATRFAERPVTWNSRTYQGSCGPSVATVTAAAPIDDGAARGVFAATFVIAPTDPDSEAAEEIAPLREVNSPYFQAARLAVLAARLPTTVMVDAVDLAIGLGSAGARARAMECLAPYLSPAHLATVLSKVMDPHTPDPADLLTPVVRYFSDDLLQQAYTAVTAIGDHFEVATALAVLTPHLAGPQLHDALALIRRTITEPNSRSPGHPGTRSAQDRGSPRAFARLVAHLPEALAAEAIPELRTRLDGSLFPSPSMLRALLALAPRLPQPDRDEAVHQVSVWITSTVDFRYASDAEVERIGYALRCASGLPASPESVELVKALAGKAVSGAKQATSGRGYASWTLRRRIGLLIGLLPHLPEPYLTEAATAAVKMIVEESADRLPVDLTATLGAYLPEALLAEAEAALTEAPLPLFLPDRLVPPALAVARRKRNVPWLFAAASRAATSLLPETLVVARELGGAAMQTELTAHCSKMLARLPTDELYDLWCDTLRAMADMDRPMLLEKLGRLAPVAAALGGQAAIDGIRQTVEDVARRWP